LYAIKFKNFRNNVLAVLLAVTTAVSPAPAALAAALDPDASRLAEPLRAAARKPPAVIDILEVQDMPVPQVLDLIRAKTGVNIEFPAGLPGAVTIYLQAVEVRDALRIILDTNGLAYREQDGVFRVMTAADYERLYGQKFGQNIQTRIIPLLHTRLEDARVFLEQMKSPDGRVVLNSDSNSFVVTDVPERLQAMEEFVRARDVQVETKIFTLKHVSFDEIRESLDEAVTPNVGRIELSSNPGTFSVVDTSFRLGDLAALVERLDQPKWKFAVQVRTVQVTLEDEHLDGVDWEAIVSGFKMINFANADKFLPEGRGLQAGAILNEDVDVLLDALETVGLVQVVQDLRVEAMDGEERSFALQFVEGDEGARDGPVEEVRYFIRPRRVAEGAVELRVRPQFSFRDRYDFGRRITSSETITLDKDETAVVGGLFRDVSVESLWKIPLLGDLPILGFAFRNQYQEKRKSEVIVLLTPAVDNQ
jgi:type II secretory pathway component GspD/PulD (secretin)